jgi:hypothetical protein
LFKAEEREWVCLPGVASLSAARVGWERVPIQGFSLLLCWPFFCRTQRAWGAPFEGRGPQGPGSCTLADQGGGGPDGAAHRYQRCCATSTQSHSCSFAPAAALPPWMSTCVGVCCVWVGGWVGGGVGGCRARRSLGLQKSAAFAVASNSNAASGTRASCGGQKHGFDEDCAPLPSFWTLKHPQARTWISRHLLGAQKLRSRPCGSANHLPGGSKERGAGGGRGALGVPRCGAEKGTSNVNSIYATLYAVKRQTKPAKCCPPLVGTVVAVVDVHRRACDEGRGEAHEVCVRACTCTSCVCMCAVCVCMTCPGAALCNFRPPPPPHTHRHTDTHDANPPLTTPDPVLASKHLFVFCVLRRRCVLSTVHLRTQKAGGRRQQAAARHKGRSPGRAACGMAWTAAYGGRLPCLRRRAAGGARRGARTAGCWRR